MADTIAAIATAQAPGGIGIVRISGGAAIFIAEKLYIAKKCLDWSRLRGYNMMYGTLREIEPPQTREQMGDARAQRSGQIPPQVVDEAICLVFRAPHSYTGEDVVEFHCHGGPLVLRRALQVVLDAGARLAAPGEFTRRAYLNGRIDLTQAEAVMQVIAARSDQALRAANNAMDGALRQRIEAVRSALIELAAHISALIDYPEEEIPALHHDALLASLRTAADALRALINRARTDQLIITGIGTAILGKPNVGKSSLMNRLAGCDRSIVTDIPGTTRDTVTETVLLGSLTLRLTDTAGIRDTAHPVERAGVERSHAAMRNADLLLLVCDASQPLAPEDEALLAACDPARTILLRNKIDLGDVWSAPKNYMSIDVSALTGQGIETLAPAAERLLGAANFDPREAILSNQRQADCARAALIGIEEAMQAQIQGFPIDAVSLCIEEAIQALFTLTGERASEAIVDEVFANFCVGK